VRTRSLALLGGAALGAGLLLPTTAQAATAETHCVQDVETGAQSCSTDEAAALRTVAPDARRATYVIARFYDGKSYTGSTLTFVKSRGCTSSYDSEWQWQDLRVDGWNDRASSVKTYNHCDVKLYQNINFGGSSSTWIDASSNLSAIGAGWNNRASSVKFS
jgi:hypothetical protein